MSTPDESRELIPESLKRAAVLLFVWILPQVVLLLLNARGYWLVSGELDPDQRSRFTGLFIFEGGLLVAGAALYACLRAGRRSISWAVNVPMLALHLAYLWAATAWIERMLPASVTTWILPPERVMLYQYTFIMPALFYAAARLACFPARIRAGADWGMTVAATIGVPVIFYVSLHVIGRMFRHTFFDLPGFIIFAGFIGGTLLMVIGLLRLLALVCDAVRRRGEHGMMVVAALVGLVCPQLGLLLNDRIPFPVDFQSLGVYAMAALNGLLLLAPQTGRPRVDLAIWLGRAALLPFTLYFFLVFLPYLPLALLAVIAMGAGFLMLTPTALMAVHGLRLWHGFADHAPRFGARRCAILAAAAFAVLPAFYTARAVAHRAVLREALEYVYASDPSSAPAFRGSLPALRHVLDHLRDQDDGIELPYLDSYYSWIVFDNLTLPPAKREGLRNAFFGPDRDEKKHNLSYELFGSRRSSRASSWRRAGPPPPTDAHLVDVRVMTEREGDTEKATLTLDVRNDTSVPCEFATTMDVPPGVFVSGYALRIGNDLVPGRIFEKKAAMWVYRTIRDMTRRDPGLLIYKDPRTLELRVFPLATNETRTTDLEFIYPAGSTPSVRIGDRTVQLSTAEPSDQAAVLGLPGRGVAVSIPAQAACPAVTRKPVLHFIIDRSAAAASSLPEQLRLAKRVAEKYPQAAATHVTLANYDSVDVAGELSTLDAASLGASLPARGGLLVDRAVRKVVLACAESSDADRATTFPLVVVLPAPGTAPMRDESPAPLQAYVPDVDGYVVCSSEDQFDVVPFAAGPAVTNAGLPEIHAVRVLRSGSDVFAVREGAAGFASVADPAAALEVFDPAGNAFKALPSVQLSKVSRYARGAAAWLDWQAAALRPSSDTAVLAGQVEQSRETGILLPVTAYIVVENSAQWNMLKLKEREKVSSLSALELKNAPEPATWFMLACVVAAVAWMRNRRDSIYGSL